jgi:hypothetical protein
MSSNSNLSKVDEDKSRVAMLAERVLVRIALERGERASPSLPVPLVLPPRLENLYRDSAGSRE